ncbi:MAG: DEAD/DEAH box helicase [Candidatus Eisenbacteria bacterium]|nr:DEAD/DEAH box helicase [Candidatus Eisenbacteria bacterium]
MTPNTIEAGSALPTVPIEETEAFATLTSLAHRKTLSIPEELLVRHILSLNRDADWSVQRAGMEALLRRVGSARQEALRVAERPPGRRLFGRYSTRRARQAERPYRTVLESIEPVRGSCDCPDYLRNSLGVCKHLIVILADICSKPKQYAYARSARAAAELPTHARFRWDPVRPLTGEGDWLARIALVGAIPSGKLPAEIAGAARRWFDSPRTGERLLRETWIHDPEKRSRLVSDLLLILEVRPATGSPRGWLPDPALHSLLRMEAQRLKRVLTDRADRPALTRALRTLKGKLYPYQVEGVERMLASGRLVLGDDMGLGKTIQAIACCHALWHGGKVRRGILVVPASLKPQWLREWQQFTDTPVRVVEGGAAERRKTLSGSWRGFFIVNYEQVIRDLPALQLLKPDMIVLDEAQRIKNWATKTAACIKALQPHYRMILTGTPMENCLDELVSVIEWVDNHALEPKWRLTPAHSTFADGSKQVVGARNLDTLRLRLSACMLRRRRQEVLRQLPPRTDTVVPVELSEEQRDSHDALNQPIAQLMSIARKRPLSPSQFLRLMSLLTTQRIISNGMAQAEFATVWPDISGIEDPEPALLRGLGTPKLLEFREIVNQVVVEQGRKIVVFSQWRRMLALAQWAVRDILRDSGVRSVFFTGQESQKQRTANIVAFHDDPDTRIFFATDAGGVGLNLQKAATCCINIELPWNPAVLEQRIGRINRLGQKWPIDVYNLVSQDCIEARIAAVVADKRALFTGLFDGASDEIRFERSGSFLSTMERLIEKPAIPDAPDLDGASAEASGAVEAELDEVVSAADESQDSSLRPGSAGPGTAESARMPEAPPPAGDIRTLFAGLKVRRTDEGGLTIEAPPETAATLAAVLEGLAQVLKGQ